MENHGQSLLPCKNNRFLAVERRSIDTKRRNSTPPTSLSLMDPTCLTPSSKFRASRERWAGLADWHIEVHPPERHEEVGGSIERGCTALDDSASNDLTADRARNAAHSRTASPSPWTQGSPLSSSSDCGAMTPSTHVEGSWKPSLRLACPEDLPCLVIQKICFVHAESSGFGLPFMVLVFGPT